MTKLFNKNAFKIKVSTGMEIKRLDGGYNFNILVEHWESGVKQVDEFEFLRDRLGHVTIDPISQR